MGRIIRGWWALSLPESRLLPWCCPTICRTLHLPGVLSLYLPPTSLLAVSVPSWLLIAEAPLSTKFMVIHIKCSAAKTSAILCSLCAVSLEKQMNALIHAQGQTSPKQCPLDRLPYAETLVSALLHHTLPFLLFSLLQESIS